MLILNPAGCGKFSTFDFSEGGIASSLGHGSSRIRSASNNIITASLWSFQSQASIIQTYLARTALLLDKAGLTARESILTSLWELQTNKNARLGEDKGCRRNE
jgi:hypothetical protein